MRHLLWAAVCLPLLMTAASAAENCGPLHLVSRVDLVPNKNATAEFVPVEIAGVPKLMLLDTGAPYSTISKKVTEELKLSTRESKIKLYTVTGAYGHMETQVPVKMGNMKGDIRLIVVPVLDSFYEESLFAGLLGSDVLVNFDVSIDFGTHRLDLIDKNHCEGQAIYWPADAVAVVPINRQVSRDIVIDVELDGKTVKAILDTGATHSTLQLK